MTDTDTDKQDVLTLRQSLEEHHRTLQSLRRANEGPIGPRSLTGSGILEGCLSEAIDRLVVMMDALQSLEERLSSEINEREDRQRCLR